MIILHLPGDVVPDRDELVAWLVSTGHQAHAFDLCFADASDAPAIAYTIADEIDADLAQPETETLPAALRAWADREESNPEE